MMQENTSLDDTITEMLNTVAKNFFAQEEAAYFRMPKVKESCISLTAEVMQRIWPGSERFQPQSVYEEQKERFLSLSGDITIDIAYKLLTTKKRFRNQRIPSLLRNNAHTFLDSFHVLHSDESVDVYQFAKNVLNPLPPGLVTKVLTAVPDEDQLVKKLVDDYGFQRNDKNKRTASVLDGKTSGVMYCVIMDSFERRVAEYITETFCKG